MTFTLPSLPYEYNALEPIIDAQTMEIHHSRHHLSYIAKLNEALEESEYLDWSLEDLLTKLHELPEEIQTAIQNHWGWHRNHSMFWEIMIPWGKAMSEAMKKKIAQNFWSIEEFNDMFTSAALSRFGSGRAWLVKDGESLSIISTANQDNPLSDGMTPILGIDVWEHAYYLKYLNKRPDYIKAWMGLINWEKVEELLEK